MTPSKELTAADAAMIRADVAQSDIAALMQCNGGRISEINTGQRHADVPALDLANPQNLAVLAQLIADQHRRLNGVLASVAMGVGAS
jgi:hypothetical protein